MRVYLYVLYIVSFLILSGSLHAASISGPTKACHGSTYSYTLYGGSGSNIDLTVTGGVFSNGNNTQSFYNYSSPVTFTVIWNSTNGQGELSCWEITSSGSSYYSDFYCNVIYMNLSITPASSSITSGSSLTLSASASVNQPFSYAWTCNRSNCNMNSTTSKSVTVSPTVTTQYTVTGYGEADSYGNACSKSATATVTVVADPISGNLICCEQWLCGSSDPAVLGQQEGTSLSGGTTPYSYQWQSSSNNGGAWANIPSATGSTYNPDVLSQTMHFRRVVNPGALQHISNVAIVNVVPNVRNLSTTTFSSNITVKASEQVNISGNISSVSGITGTIKSGREINVLPPSNLTPNIDLFIEVCSEGSSYKIATADYYNDIEPAVGADLNAGPYPNPISEGEVNFGKRANKFFLFNANGTLIRSGINAEKLDINGLSKGIYFLIIDDQKTKMILQ